MALNKLKIRLKDEGVTYSDMGEKLGISTVAFQRKINGDTQFKLSEIRDMTDFLKLTGEEVEDIFFDQ